MRVALFTNIPTAYRAPLYARLSDLLGQSGGELLVVFGAANEAGRQWSEAHPAPGAPGAVVLRSCQVRLGRRITYLGPGAIPPIANFRPDVVIVSGYSPASLLLSAWCRLRGVPYLVWSGETPLSAVWRRPNPARRRGMLRSAAGCLAYGPEAGDYLRALAVPRELVHVVGNGIEAEDFAALVAAARHDAPALRRRYDVGEWAVLSVGGKNLSTVAAVTARISPPPQVLVAGQDARPARLPSRVRFLGRLPSSQMPSVYAVAGCLAHPPLFDRWPHAINEALAAGIPVVATPACGIPRELCDGPGSSICPDDPEALATAIERALDVGVGASPQVRARIAAPLRPWSVPAMAQRMMAACEAALA